MDQDHGPATGARVTIRPPKTQEPQYASIQATGEQILGLTGDGRIHTWTQDHTPKQVPSPTQAPAGFHWLQAAAGSRRQAALGSDQHIYTWNSQQPEPVTLDTGQDTQFTSISMNGDRLLAVDRQGRVHTFQTDQADSQNPNPQPAEQATLSLPGKTQAVNAVASASQALIVDADGQAWTWDANNTGESEPERVRQDPGMRILQAQALNQGFLLLDADGQARYLADNTTDSAAVNLPEGMKASRTATNDSQAIITDKNGKVWAWKPGETPISADNGNQAYTQAVLVGGRITAISRQGGVFTWSLDKQGQPGKPARITTTQAPTLETASTDGRPLTPDKTGDAWQADIPARQPGQATITITGRQDGQPFTKSLTYTVDQTLTRDNRQGSTYTVHFDTGGGNPEPADQSFSTPNGRVKRPSPDPTREGFLFDGWFTGQAAYDFSRPVTDNITITAHWTPNKQWSISPNKGSQFGHESTTITPPNTSRGIRFSQISGGYDYALAVGSDGNAYAWGDNSYGQLGDGTRTNRRTTPVVVRKPAGTPTDFTYVQVSAGYWHSLAQGSDGNTYAWGLNVDGRLGNGTTSDFENTPVRVKTPDRNTYPDLPADFTYVQISAGGWHSLAIGSDGNTYAWGNNYYDQLGDGTNRDRTTPVRVKTPDRNKYPDLPKDFTYVQVSAGIGSLAVGSDGNAYAWGNNTYGQLGDGTTYNFWNIVRVKTPDRNTYPDLPADFTYVQVSAGINHSLAVGSDGNAYAWGRNSNGQLGDGTTSDRTTPVKVKTPDRNTYPDLPADFTYVQISAGTDHSLAVGSDGNAWVWACNWSGPLSNSTSSGTSDANPVPVRVPDPANPTDKSKGLQTTQVSGGYQFSLALGSDENAYAWGYNWYGQLGNGTTSDNKENPIPVPVSFNLAPVITGVKFDQTAVSGLTHGKDNSMTVLTPIHVPGTVTVSVDYTMGGTGSTLTDTSLRYTYLPAGVLPKAGGEGILLALATGMTGMGGVLASRRHRKETHQLLHASYE